MLKKIIFKAKQKIAPSGRSVISSGLAKGLTWTHEVSDLRYLCGNYEEVLASWLKSKVETGHSFIDIGANAGYFCLIAAKYRTRDEQRIIAVEPAEPNLDFIRKHTHWNGFSEIEILPVAVSDKNQKVTFSNSPNMAANTYVEASFLHQTYPKVEVEARTLDLICRETGITNFVIKIDVEGAELDVLKGAVEVLKTHRPEIILATHECHVPGIEQSCIDFLAAAGYTCEPIADEKFVDGQKDYLCRHRG